MIMEKQIGKATVKVIKGDITLLDVDGFVFYAQPSLALGSGFGNAIAQRGGPAVQEELKAHGPARATEVVTTTAGDLKAKHILHAVGPRFQESDLEGKLRTTMKNILAQAGSHAVARLAVPPLGVGFYGVPLPLAAKVTVSVLKEELARQPALTEVIICCTDTRELAPFENELKSL